MKQKCEEEWCSGGGGGNNDNTVPVIMFNCIRRNYKIIAYCIIT